MRTNLGLVGDVSNTSKNLEILGIHPTAIFTYKFPILTAAVICLSILPIIFYNHLPLMDYPNHLAELEIRKTLSSNIAFAKFYGFHWRLIPNIGLDLFATPLLSFLSVQIIGKIIIIMSFLMIYMGTILLDHELNPANWGLSIFAGIFLYNGPFNFGFINYVIGIGFAIWAFWMWLRLRDANGLLTVSLFTIVGGVVGLMHFSALAIYGVCVAGYECSVLWENLRAERRLRISLFRIPFKAAIGLIIPMLAAVVALRISALAVRGRTLSNHGAIVWGRSWGSQTFWDSFVKWKAEGLSSPIYFHNFLEKPLVIATCAILAWALVTRTLVVNSRMVIPLAAFGLLFIILPSELFGGTVSFIDYRLPSAVAFFALASLGSGQASRVRLNVLCLMLALCLIVRVGSVLVTWRFTQPIIHEYDTALQTLPTGSRLDIIFDDSAWGYPPLIHVPVFAAAKQGVVERQIFSENGVELQLLRLKRLIRPGIEDFDYLLAIGHPRIKIPNGISLRQVVQGNTFTIYRIVRLHDTTHG